MDKVNATSILPGTILSVNFKEGDTVESNQTVAVVESMKMENDMVAFEAGTVSAVKVKVGDVVKDGQTLLELTT